MDEDRIQAWVGRAAGGDVLAVQKLIMFYNRRLRLLAERRLTGPIRRKVDADDILQFVYSDAVGRIGEFVDRGRESFFRWLSTILESKLIDAHRFYHAARRDLNRDAPSGDRHSGFQTLLERAAVDSCTPSRVIAMHERQALVMAALAGLSTDHRRVLELRYLQGLPLTEVAANMDRTPAAVQMLSARALRRLRTMLTSLSRASL